MLGRAGSGPSGEVLQRLELSWATYRTLTNPPKDRAGPRSLNHCPTWGRFVLLQLKTYSDVALYNPRHELVNCPTRLVINSGYRLDQAQ